MVLFFDEGEASAVGAQTGVFLNKELGLHAQKTGDLFDLIVLHPHVTWPLAACSASVTLIPKFGHIETIKTRIDDYETCHMSPCHQELGMRSFLPRTMTVLRMPLAR